MKTVIVNESFRDRYDTSKVYKAGETYQLSEERITEIRATKSSLITVIGPSVAAVEETKATTEIPEIKDEEESVDVEGEETIEEVEKPKRTKKDTTKVE